MFKEIDARLAVERMEYSKAGSVTSLAVLVTNEGHSGQRWRLWMSRLLAMMHRIIIIILCKKKRWSIRRREELFR